MATILVVEDDPVNLMVATHAIRRMGHEVVAVGRGEEAVAAVRGHQPALVLMDRNLPGMDGDEALRHIRAFERDSGGTRRTPVVLMTADVATAVSLGGAEGFDDRCPKPFRMEALRRVLARWLGTADAAATGPAAREDDADKAAVAAALGQLQALQPDRPEFPGEVVQLFLESTRRLLDGLEQAVAAGDAATARRAGHTLKSSCGQVGAMRLSALGAMIEKAAQAGAVPADAPASARRLFEAAAQTLRACLADLGHPGRG